VFDAKFSLNGNQSLYDQYGSSRSFLTLALPQGKPQTDPGWALEISLDVEWAHAIAPGAKILLVEAATTSYNDIINAVDYARNQIGVVAVSMSWGSEEFQPEAIFDSYFTTPYGHLGGSNGFGGFNLPGGVTFVAASGDYGSPPEWPAISPNVLAVGGTTLNLDANGNYQFETPWLFSGGGISAYEPRPYYQTGTPSSNLRTNPDVGFNADPRSGFAVFDSVGVSGFSGWLRVGGTSAGAPQWAALIAIADQGRALMGNGSLDGITQTLPAIYALPDSVFHIPLAAFQLIPGSNYSLETGRGTPIANLLIPALPGMSPPPPPVAIVPSPPADQPPGADTPGSPPNKSPGKTDNGSNLALVKIILTDQPPNPGITSIQTGQVTHSPTDSSSLGITFSTPVPTTLIRMGLRSVVNNLFAPEGKTDDVGANEETFAQENEVQESIGQVSATDGASSHVSITARESIKKQMNANSSAERKEPIPNLILPVPISLGLDGEPRQKVVNQPRNRKWEWAGLLLGLAVLLGPYLAKSERKVTGPN
jgi:hypothetical protein